MTSIYLKNVGSFMDAYHAMVTAARRAILSGIRGLNACSAVRNSRNCAQTEGFELSVPNCAPTLYTLGTPLRACVTIGTTGRYSFRMCRCTATGYTRLGTHGPIPPTPWPKTMSEQQRVAIVTGAAGGIGRELVLGLLGKGLKVAAVDGGLTVNRV